MKKIWITLGGILTMLQVAYAMEITPPEMVLRQIIQAATPEKLPSELDLTRICKANTNLSEKVVSNLIQSLKTEKLEIQKPERMLDLTVRVIAPLKVDFVFEERHSKWVDGADYSYYVVIRIDQIDSKSEKDRDAAAFELVGMAKPVMLALDAMHKDSTLEQDIFNRLKKEDSVDGEAYCNAIRKTKLDRALALVRDSAPGVKAAVVALRSAGAQQSKHIYIFQAYYWPENDHPEVLSSQMQEGFSVPDEWRYHIEAPEGYSGTWRKWYKSGELMEQTDYVKGKLHGKVIAFQKDGRKTLESSFQEGRKDGDCREWDQSGVLICSGTYKNGSRWSGTFKVETKGSYIIDEYKDGKRMERRSKEVRKD